MKRESFDHLEEAIGAMEARVEEVRAQGPVKGVKMIRDFEPDERVVARIELSTGGWLRGRDAGVDVMGDGSLVPYTGGIRRRELAPPPGESVFETIRRSLGG